MARDYDHLFKLLIIGDSGKKQPGRWSGGTGAAAGNRPSQRPDASGGMGRAMEARDRVKEGGEAAATGAPLLSCQKKPSGSGGGG